MLGANLRTGADEGALPDAFIACNGFGARVLSAIAGVEIIAVGESESRRPYEVLIQFRLWTGGIAQETVNALSIVV